MLRLKKILEQKKCFKLICGAGNQNLEEISRLVAVYAKAGCHFFDLANDNKVFEAAQKGLDFVIPKDEQKDYHFCISIGTKGDQHVQKAFIDSEKCTNCGACVKICPQNAIEAKGKRQKTKGRVGLLSHRYEVIKKNCIGCMRCQKVCECGAIVMTPHPIFQTLVPRVEKCPLPQGEKGPHFTLHPSRFTCIELHASDTDENEVDEIWNYLNEKFDGMLSFCLSRKNLSDEQILSRVNRLVQIRKPYTTIIQADGNPMSGGKDDFETTRPAVEMGKLIQSANLPVYLLLSGGTNSKTAELADREGVNINGVAVGSFARKIVKNQIEREDFWENKAIFEEASKIAARLIRHVSSSL